MSISESKIYASRASFGENIEKEFSLPKIVQALTTSVCSYLLLVRGFAGSNRAPHTAQSAILPVEANPNHPLCSL
jgi:hypothetical protein